LKRCRGRYVATWPLNYRKTKHMRRTYKFKDAEQLQKRQPPGSCVDHAMAIGAKDHKVLQPGP
jgi:hypothetical protein